MKNTNLGLDPHVELLGELDHAKRVVAQAGLGIRPGAQAIQRAVEGIEAAWMAFGEASVASSWEAVTVLERGLLPQVPRCIAAVRELSSLVDTDEAYAEYRDHGYR